MINNKLRHAPMIPMMLLDSILLPSLHSITFTALHYPKRGPLARIRLRDEMLVPSAFSRQSSLFVLFEPGC